MCTARMMRGKLYFNVFTGRHHVLLLTDLTALVEAFEWQPPS